MLYLNENVPQCFICRITLANASLKPNKLIRHLKTNHNQYKNKTRNLFLRKLKEFKQNKKMIKTYTVEHKIYLKCSHLAALHIANLKIPYLIEEKLLKPCMIDICSEFFSNEHVTKIKKNTYV